ncbi:TIGR03943 family protein [Microcoleus sp. LEGE 07076]|uniref:TIGR03943 family putative permease subunit n=1 Tax=Microcoleus sp. LEGE 07076 TaxID=915322 RepID=UPI0018808947|nr:TIGR03943 family protein [Microcoleus sp. LEGE 07076]MBE9184372.1 TIGR03943 family protein [Microcoleus sp. LEGE 07076]
MNLKKISPWLDALAILAWGILLLKYWITGKLSILIHPNYFGLTVAGGIGLMVIGGLKIWELLKVDRPNKQLRTSPANKPLRITEVEHITLFPPSIGSTLMLSVALIGLAVTPRTFTSQTALERGLTESLPITRLQPQEFRNTTKPEKRSLVEWVRLLNFNPEPDTYRNQKVKVQGFVIHPPNISEQYMWIGRFIITCCAADAYPIGLPVKLPIGQNRASFAPDSWLEIEGETIVEELQDKRKLIIQASSLKPIPEPKNPYDY